MKRLTAMLVAVGIVNVLGNLGVEGSTVVVTANPLWKDTALTLNIGDTVSITATGTWRFSTVDPAVGPNGVYHAGGLYDEFYSGALHGALIAFIGVDPYQGQWGDGGFFPKATGYLNIGTNSVFISDTAGKLWLGFNDAAVTKATADNSGSVTAQISITPIPEPSGFLLVLLGAGVLTSCLRIIRRLL